MKEIKTSQAVGQALCHDIVRIVIGQTKETAFKRGHVIRQEDVEALLQLGKDHIFVMEEGDKDLLHEEDVARALYQIAGGPNMHASDVNQGRIDAIADCDGLLKVDVDLLHAINSIGQLTIVTKFTNSSVKAGQKLAGMRCIPLMLDKKEVDQALALAEDRKVLAIKPFVRKTIGLVVTGSEVFHGRIKDAFTPIIKERAAAYGMEVIAQKTVPDDTDQIVEAIESLKAQGVDAIFCTGGMSVDPDDLTPGAIDRFANRVVTYGLPVLPGSMVCIAYAQDGTPILGLPGGVLFSSPTAFDALLPRVAADDPISKEECIAMGHGGFMGK